MAVVRTLKADVASLFANIRRAKEAVLRTDAAETSTDPAQDCPRLRQGSDRVADETSQPRDDAGFEFLPSNKQPESLVRAEVVRALKRNVAAVFAQARARKSLASSANDTAASATAASESVLCRLEDIHDYDPELCIALKRNDPQTTLVTDEAAQPEKQPIRTKPKPQPRRPGLSLQRWLSKTKKS